jgi:hypothetical protein
MSENCLRKLTISLIACLLDGCLTYSNSVSKVSIVEFNNRSFCNNQLTYVVTIDNSFGKDLSVLLEVEQGSKLEKEKTAFGKTRKTQ